MDRNELRSRLEQLVFSGQYPKAEKIISQVLSEEESPSLRAEAKRQSAQILTIRGKWDEAAEELDEAIGLATEAGDYEALSDCLTGMSVVKDYQGQFEEALAFAREALQLAREHNYRRGEAEALVGMGLVLHDQGKYDEALEHYQESLELCQQIGWRVGEAESVGNIGSTMATGKRRLDQALAHLHRAVEINREVGNRWGEATCLGNIGATLVDKGEFDDGLSYLERALEIDREIGYRLGEGVRLGSIGHVLARLGRPDEALRRYEERLEIAEEIGSPLLKTWALKGIGFVRVQQELLEEAIQPLQQAIQIAEEVGAVDDAADAGLALGDVFRRLQRYDDARLVLSTAKARYEEIGDDLGARLADYRIESIERETEPGEVPEEQKAIDELADVLPELKEMWQAAAGRQRELEKYLTQAPADEENRFVVLRQWNSFTPIFAFRPEKARGGGYYLNWRGRGLVIDPGFSFIENLYSEGFSIADLDAVLITHAHLDHVSDMEPLLDLLHHCAELEAKARAKRRGANARSKSLDFFLNLSSFGKFSEGLAHCDGLGILHPLREGQRFEPEGYDLAITPVAAKHEELGKRHVAIGLLFDLLDRDRNCLCRLAITGDSGFVGKTWVRKFAGVDVLVAHIGTISEDEVLKGKLYDKHLGFRGLFRLCQILRDEDQLPRVLLISEFGEELKGFRVRIAELLQSKIGADTKVFAADIGLRVQLSPNRENIYVLCSHGHPGKSGCISEATSCVDKNGRLLAVCGEHADR